MRRNWHECKLVFWNVNVKLIRNAQQWGRVWVNVKDFITTTTSHLFPLLSSTTKKLSILYASRIRSHQTFNYWANKNSIWCNWKNNKKKYWNETERILKNMRSWKNPISFSEKEWRNHKRGEKQHNF